MDRCLAALQGGLGLELRGGAGYVEWCTHDTEQFWIMARPFASPVNLSM